MSIALEARVAELEKQSAEMKARCSGLDGELNALRDALKYFREQLAARKPGPKPKESNG